MLAVLPPALRQLPSVGMLFQYLYRSLDGYTLGNTNFLALDVRVERLHPDL